MPIAVPDFADVAAAHLRIRPLAWRTPLLENQRVNDRLGGRLLLKAEVLQKSARRAGRQVSIGISKLRVRARTAYLQPHPRLLIQADLQLVTQRNSTVEHAKQVITIGTAALNFESQI